MTHDELRSAIRLFGLGERATIEEIKTRYRELVKRHHPDGGTASRYAAGKAQFFSGHGGVDNPEQDLGTCCARSVGVAAHSPVIRLVTT
jgi:hypothetical protein